MAREHLHAGRLPRPAAPAHVARRRTKRVLTVLLATCALAACRGPGPYGFSRTYEPLLTERKHLDRAQDLPYEQVKRAPYDYKNIEVAWFGVVESLSDLPDGRSQVRLAVRTPQARNLCRDEYQDSCRLTVSETSPGKFVARVVLSEEEKKAGKERVWNGSLLKVYGTPTGDYDEHGDPVIEASYHRHWPRGYYVTTAQRGAMRR